MEARTLIAVGLLAGLAAGCVGGPKRRFAAAARHEPTRQADFTREIDPHEVWNSAQRGQSSPQPPAMNLPPVAPLTTSPAAVLPANAPKPVAAAPRGMPEIPRLPQLGN